MRVDVSILMYIWRERGEERRGEKEREERRVRVCFHRFWRRADYAVKYNLDAAISINSKE